LIPPPGGPPSGHVAFASVDLAPLDSADPLHNKEATLRVIVEKGGDYLVGTKGNTSNRFEAVEKALERTPF
jgi:hypothetical protein